MKTLIVTMMMTVVVVVVIMMMMTMVLPLSNSRLLNRSRKCIHMSSKEQRLPMLKSHLYCLFVPHIPYLESTKIYQVNNVSKVFRAALAHSKLFSLLNKAVGQKDLQVQVLLCHLVRISNPKETQYGQRCTVSSVGKSLVHIQVLKCNGYI